MWSDNLSVVERVTTSLDRNVVRRSWDNGDLWLVASDWLDCFGASDTLSRTGYVRGTLPLMRRQWPAISNDPWSMNTSCNWRTRFSRLHAAGYVLFTSTWLSNGRPPPFSLLLRAVKIRTAAPLCFAAECNALTNPRYFLFSTTRVCRRRLGSLLVALCSCWAKNTWRLRFRSRSYFKYLPR
ncbi:unnamed protein product [Durusdinium trenchii]|uniref:Uncharacterized protein n=1 Tax=Durusdinium trenchii TaxID=1381693 RepID=A0ABP0M2E8_9DINO